MKNDIYIYIFKNKLLKNKLLNKKKKERKRSIRNSFENFEIGLRVSVVESYLSKVTETFGFC